MVPFFSRFTKHLLLILFSACYSITASAGNLPNEGPQGLKSEVLGSTQAKVSWEGTRDDKYYEVRKREAGSNFWTYFTVTAPTTSRRLTNLKPATTYEWEVQSYGDSKKDASGFVTGGKFTTFSNCDLPDDYTVHYSGLNSATLSWGYGQNIEKYAVRIKTADEDSHWKTYFTEFPSVTFSDLEPYTEYEWQISSYCTATSNTGSEFSPSEYFSTESYLQSSINQVMITRGNLSMNKANEILSSSGYIVPQNNYVKMVNILGQTIQQFPISYTDSAGDLYFDLSGQQPEGIYFIRVPVELNSSGQKILVK